MGQRLDAFDLFTGLAPARYAAVEDGFGEDLPRLARRYAVTHVLLPPPGRRDEAATALATERAHLEGTDPRTGAEIWAVPHREWASFPEEIAVVPGRREALRALYVEFRRRGRAAIVEADRPMPAAPGIVRAVERGRERIRIEAEALGDAVLVVNDAYWPGWRATLDGAPTPILAADVLVRAVAWPAGRHVLEMRFDPPEVTAGAWMTVAGAALLAAAAWRPRRRPRAA